MSRIVLFFSWEEFGEIRLRLGNGGVERLESWGAKLGFLKRGKLEGMIVNYLVNRAPVMKVFTLSPSLLNPRFFSNCLSPSPIPPKQFPELKILGQVKS